MNQNELDELRKALEATGAPENAMTAVLFYAQYKDGCGKMPGGTDVVRVVDVSTYSMATPEMRADFSDVTGDAETVLVWCVPADAIFDEDDSEVIEVIPEGAVCKSHRVGSDPNQVPPEADQVAFPDEYRGFPVKYVMTDAPTYLLTFELDDDDDDEDGK